MVGLARLASSCATWGTKSRHFNLATDWVSSEQLIPRDQCEGLATFVGSSSIISLPQTILLRALKLWHNAHGLAMLYYEQPHCNSLPITLSLHTCTSDSAHLPMMWFSPLYSSVHNKFCCSPVHNQFCCSLVHNQFCCNNQFCCSSTEYVGHKK